MSVVLAFRSIFTVLNVGCDFKNAANMFVHIGEFVWNLLTAAYRHFQRGNQLNWKPLGTQRRC